ncbi:DUF222 domain-containing protein [Rhodococcus hoagii]|nr:DUF222 domain-containing protein [Prescottella equi]MBM4650533.1 DUF222 domain-containing protein [Prescottella equi]MBM4683629.1 DUF222 domain-containing protein [Prescottella equi]
MTTLFVIRCEEDARAGRNEARGEFAHVEVAGVLGLTESAARRMIDLGCDLRWHLHQVRAELQAGRIDLAKAHALSEALSNVSDDKLEDIERRLLDGAGRSTTSRLEERARRLIARLDPDGVRGTTTPSHRRPRRQSNRTRSTHAGSTPPTLLGFDDAPGYLSGYGAIDADLARELAADATWKRILMLSAADRAGLAGLAEGSLGGPVLGSGPPLPAPKHSPPTRRERESDCRKEPIGRVADCPRSSAREMVCADSRTAPRRPPPATSTTRFRSTTITPSGADSPPNRILPACVGPITDSRRSAIGPSVRSVKVVSNGSIPPAGPRSRIRADRSPIRRCSRT